MPNFNRISSRSVRQPVKEASKISLWYLLFGLVWIAISDRIVSMLFADPEALAQAQLIKGWLFIAVTALLLFYLSARALRLSARAYQSDPLTKLLRHDRFRQLIDDHLSHAKPAQHFILIYCDIDHFSQLNKDLGHERADLIISQLSDRFRQHFPAHTLLARIAADQFAIGIVSDECDEAIARTIESLNSLVALVGMDFDRDLTATYGAALAPQDAKTAKSLMWSASEALRLGKVHSRNQLTFYNAKLSAQKMDALQLAHELKHALDHGDLSLVYQPQFNMKREIVGVEVLVRWRHPSRGFISPAIFVPLAETYGMIGQLTEYVIDTSYQALKPMLGQQLHRVSVNTSAAEINSPALIKKLEQSIRRYPDYAQYLQLEVTETAAIENLAYARAQMLKLCQLGLRFSLDDFGTGYSSLSMIKELPLTEVKIDRSFINSMMHENGAKTIVESVIGIAKGYELIVVAEGVEHQEEFELLARMGCSEVQGYLLSRPIKIEQLYQQLVAAPPLP